MKFAQFVLLTFAFAVASASSQPARLSMSQTDLVRHLAEEREHYLSGFRASYKAWCQEKRNICAAELLMRPNKTLWPEPYAQMRLDMVSNVNGKFEASRYEQETPRTQLAAPKAVKLGELNVQLHSVVWNRVEVRSARAPATLLPLSAWVDKWMDFRDTKSAGPDGLAGVVHGTTFPVKTATHWQFMVDFGSAPVEAFTELMTAVAQMGLRDVSVGSFSPIQQ
jgi:hypothetical protein